MKEKDQEGREEGRERDDQEEGGEEGGEGGGKNRKERRRGGVMREYWCMERKERVAKVVGAVRIAVCKDHHTLV